MDIFDERENAFEAKFAHDAEMQFKAEARANRHLALWAAGLLGKKGDEVEEYVREVIRADLQEPGHDDVIAKVVKDLEGIVSEEEIRAKRRELLKKAKAELLEEI